MSNTVTQKEIAFATTISQYSPYHIRDYTILYAGTPASGQTIPLCKGYPFNYWLTYVTISRLFFMNRDVLINAGALPVAGNVPFYVKYCRVDNEYNGERKKDSK
jgi:hypothetical protein